MPRCAKIKKQYGKLFNSSVLYSVYSFYPIISSQGVMDIEGNIYTGVAEVMDDPLIQKYHIPGDGGQGDGSFVLTDRNAG